MHHFTMNYVYKCKTAWGCLSWRHAPRGAYEHLENYQLFFRLSGREASLKARQLGFIGVYKCIQNNNLTHKEHPCARARGWAETRAQ